MIQMRDKNQSIPDYLNSLEKELKKVPERILDLRNHVIDSPNFTFDHLSGLPRKREEIFSLLLFLKWFPWELQSFFRIELEEKIRKFSWEDQKELWLLLELSQEETLYFLSCYPKYSDRDFFGNLLPKGRKILEKISFSNYRERKEKKSQRKRGYNDQGSRRPDSKWLPSFDYSFLEEQNYLETKKEFLRDYIQHTKKIISQDIVTVKETMNFEKDFPVSCRALGKTYFCGLIFENWDNEELPLHDYLKFCSKI